MCETSLLYTVRRWQCGREVFSSCDDRRRVKGKVFSSSQRGENKLDTAKQKNSKGARSALAFCAPFVCPWRGGGSHGNTHAIITADAMTMGKHVYCQKPLTHSVYESRLLTNLAASTGVVTQMGNQGSSDEGTDLVCEWIWNGEIGDITKVECATDRPIWPQGLNVPEKVDKIPSTLNWDLFTGPMGRGVECAIKHNPDMELVGVFTRRAPETVKILTETAKVYSVDDAEKMKDQIDVMILCGGSATDLPEQTPKYAQWFNVVDSFDTHKRIPEHFANVDKAASENGHVGIISVGWDPGMFSLNRMYANAILTNGKDYTFWGKGVSQGHSDAIRRIKGVKDGKQYTIPVEAALEAVRSGKNPELTTREKHTRECFVVAEEGADLARIENEIKTMPNYFDEYDTTVHFISEEELKRDHSGIPHGGFVIRTGKTGWNDENSHVIEYSLKLDSNPEFTSSVIVAYARAAYRMNQEGQKGCKTVFDVAPAYLSALSGEELRKHLL